MAETPWQSRCCESNCIETRLAGDQVEIRDTERPEATLLVPAKAWEEFLASVRAERVGICGNQLDSVLGGPMLVCDLPAGHDGWHGADNPTELSPPSRCSWSTEVCRCGVPLASHQCTYCHDDPPRGHACPRCARPAGHVGPWLTDWTEVRNNEGESR